MNAILEYFHICNCSIIAKTIEITSLQAKKIKNESLKDSFKIRNVFN